MRTNPLFFVLLALPGCQLLLGGLVGAEPCGGRVFASCDEAGRLSVCTKETEFVIIQDCASAGLVCDEALGVCSPQKSCGNGALDDGEACDDGNNIDGDQCDSNCTPPGCGNGVASPGELCLPATAQQITISGTGATALAAADLEQDNDLDVAVINEDNSAVILQNDGQGGLAGLPSITLGGVPLAIVAGDFNGGRPDLAILSNDNQVTPLFSQGNGALNIAAQTPVDAGCCGYVSMSAGDIDGDGDLDLLTTRSGAEMGPLQNNSGLFSPLTPLPVGLSFAGEIALADFTGDGQIDIAVLATVTFPDGVIRIFLGGGFISSLDVPVLNRPRPLTSGDLEGDEDIDLVTRTDSNVVVAINNGSGQFTTSSLSGVGSGGGGIALGDLDNDSDLEIVAANQAQDEVTVFLNNPNGFVALPAFSVGSQPAGLIVADLNGDSALDIATANQNNSTTAQVSVLFSQP